jgi:outer membrane protein OmpA-like peptidoglycan-associated protein
VIVSGQVIHAMMQREGKSWDDAQKALVDNARIILMNRRTGRVTDEMQAKEGRFAFKVANSGDYVLIGKQSGYFVSKKEVDKGSFEPGMQKDMNIRLQKIVMNQPNPAGKMPNVQFAFDSYQLDVSMRERLENVAQVIRENPEIRLELAGHACPIGPSAYNMELSKHRAEAVADYLIRQQNINKVQLFTEHYGEQDLLVPNPQTDQEYAINRRTEFIVRNVALDPEQEQPATKQAPTKEAQPTGEKFASSAGANSNSRETGVYQVRHGDTLYSIAQAHDMTVGQLVSLNGLQNTMIEVGQVLRVTPMGQ